MKDIGEQRGLYRAKLEKDACGIGLIANLDGIRSQELVSNALTMLENMEHRGACGCEPNSGDGAGILVHIPYQYFKETSENFDIELPAPGKFGVGNFFVPKSNSLKKTIKDIIGDCAGDLNFNVLGFRPVKVNNLMVGDTALSTEPDILQVFFSHVEVLDPKSLDRKLFVLRKHINRQVTSQLPGTDDSFYICSLSSRTIVYKGQLTSHQLRSYYPELSHPKFQSAIALIHSRFSTNTSPRWKLAQPFRCISHNGEINTIQGNINWWKAREKTISSQFFTEKELDILFPIINEDDSDSACFDSVLEFLIHSGRTIPHTLMMMIPEAWQNSDLITPEKKAFYEYHEALMEPWDGPASICFTDGTLVGATLDRNGLRPSRYLLTNDNILILASETGVLPVDPAKVVLRERLEPGKILIADLDEHRIIHDKELKSIISNRKPYQKWVEDSKYKLDSFQTDPCEKLTPDISLIQKQIANGFSKEDEKLILQSMLKTKAEPIGSMGSDIPLAILSRQAQHIANYFKQQFAQVTNPPIDPLREKEFMTLKTLLGGCENLLDVANNRVKYVRLESPVLQKEDFEKLCAGLAPQFVPARLDATFAVRYQSGSLKDRLYQLCREAENAILSGKNLLIISNHLISETRVPIPSLLILGAVHHHLIRQGLRHKASLIVDGSDLLEVQHFATLISYGADAVYPRLAYETIAKNIAGISDFNGMSADSLLSNYRKAVEKGLLKVMSKLGISTLLSYKGAQTFEALGIASDVIEMCFNGTISRIEGMNFDMLAKEAIMKHNVAFHDKLKVDSLPDLGIYQWKRRGEFHLFNPESIHLLQFSTRQNDYSIYKKYTESIDRQEQKNCTLRSLLDFNKSKPIPIEEVESVESILKRFATGAMSFGSISHEAHSTLAIAMNRIGGRSNSGEGGEDEARYKKLQNGDWERSAIKQVASGRFGVTINYLTNALELQIKMAQGAKPGEGGQLPGHKVNEWIARVRNSTPGVGLISPPPHHDIYSIEDLAQLIFDLKNANRSANISVKLVSKAGVGIIASGVTKGHADHILISGHDGGTGASPLSSIRHAGLPWELGLAETHQVLMINKLRDRVIIQVDGQIRTGRDLAIATLLGAEEWGIATAALVVEGCILMRKCHLNSCPVGIATQKEELRAKFNGKVDHVVNFFNFLAQDLREIMAELGYRTVNEMVGQSQHLGIRNLDSHWKLKNLDLNPVLHRETVDPELREYNCISQDHGLDDVLDRKLIEYSKNAINDLVSIHSTFAIKNTDRATGTMLSNEIAKKHGENGLQDDSINFRFRGSAGQSFGAFGAKGLTFVLEGDANDYFGKGLSGAKLILVPDRHSLLESSKNAIVGNVALYGATSGEVYIRGKAGERFGVRNSGVNAVVEGVGAHGCEYMTGGRVVVLGPVGRNFAAGMSGGIAYVYDPNNQVERFLNRGMVELEIPDDDSSEEIRSLIRNHFRYTGSMNALEVLRDWKYSRHQFVRVMPGEYKQVLLNLQKETKRRRGAKMARVSVK